MVVPAKVELAANICIFEARRQVGAGWQHSGWTPASRKQAHRSGLGGLIIVDPVRHQDAGIWMLGGTFWGHEIGRQPCGQLVWQGGHAGCEHVEWILRTETPAFSDTMQIDFQTDLIGPCIERNLVSLE